MKSLHNIEKDIHSFESRGIKLWVEEDKLKYSAPKGRMTPEDLAYLKRIKEELIEYYQSLEATKGILLHPEDHYKPFPQNPIQRAYSLGKGQQLTYGGVCTHTYMEIAYDSLDPQKVEEVFNELIEIHPMLRAVVYADGSQQIFEERPKYQLIYGEDSDEDGSHISSLREELQSRYYPNGVWPQYTFAVTRLADKSILHFSMEFIITDWTSMLMLLSQFEQLYFYGMKPLKSEISFRDCVLHQEKEKSTPHYLASKNYWMQRAPEFFGPPLLPMENTSSESTDFQRLFFQLDLASWTRIKQRAASLGATPTAFVLTLYSYVLQRWSEKKCFALNLTLLHRPPYHNDMDVLFGDFTSILLHESDWRGFEKSKLQEWLVKTQKQLFEDMDRGNYSGVEFLRELSKEKGTSLLYPYAFTSALGISKTDEKGLRGVYRRGLTQTPQVIVDCQVMDGDFGFRVNWDYRKHLVKEGVFEDMFTYFGKLLEDAADLSLTLEDLIVEELPLWQKKEREEINATKIKRSLPFLHEKLLEARLSYPERVFVTESHRSISYGDMGTMVERVLAGLKKRKITPGQKIGIAMERSIEQVAAVLAILFAGCVYVPVDPDQGIARMGKIIKKAEIALVLVDKDHDFRELFCEVASFSSLLGEESSSLEITGKLGDTGYIIFTSGSTGDPKGVEMSHEAAMNTIVDLIERFKLDEGTTVLALSKLNFDLSVFDYFGMLYLGGKIVLPKKEDHLQPGAWENLIEKHGVNLWNSVPAFMEVFLHSLSSKEKISSMELRHIWLSGDWFQVSLLKKIRHYFPKATVLSMGGATEAGIWSIYHCCQEEDCEGRFIPYGRPLGNQSFAILDENLQPTPVAVAGELYILGDSLAKGYFGEEELTKKKFSIDPLTQKRRYATGDQGRYLPGGEIEFLGRNDFQVKVGGHRIELGEIEHVFLESPQVQGAMVALQEKQMLAFVQGSIDEDALLKHAQENLPDYMIPKKIYFVEAMPLTSNGKIDRLELLKRVESEEPSSEICWTSSQRELKQIFEEVLGKSIADPRDSFYDYGADSLTLSQIVNKLISDKEQISFDKLLAQIMNHPNILETDAFLGARGVSNEIH